MASRPEAAVEDVEVKVLSGYLLFVGDGAVITCGASSFHGSAVDDRRPWTAIGARPRGEGYWVLSADGVVRSFGDVLQFELRAVATTVAAVNIEVAPDGRGFWVVDAVGGVFCFGEVRYFGSLPGIGGGSAPVTAMRATPSGAGYWVLDEAGGVFSFGDARFHGSVPSDPRPFPTRAVDLRPTDRGDGYWILGGDGTVLGFGSAKHFGDVSSRGVEAVAMMPNADSGYVIVDSAGLAYPYGAAPFLGSAATIDVHARVVGVAPIVDWLPAGDA